MCGLSLNDGALTKQEAYSQMKAKLEIPKKAMIFKEAFDLFYYKTGDLYMPTMTESQMDQFILEHNLRSVNKRIFAVKQKFPTTGLRIYKRAVTDLRVKVLNSLKQTSC